MLRCVVMKPYAPRGTGFRVPQSPSSLCFTVPSIDVPASVTIHRGVLLAPPSGNRITEPPPGSWRCFAETGPKDRRQIQAIAARFGPLTQTGSTTGEDLTLWSALIEDLGALAGGWTKDGEIADPVAHGAAWATATRIQIRLVEEHQGRGERFVSYGAGGIGIVTRDMDQWWRLTALNAVWEGYPLRRCRWCGLWFSLKHQRSDQQFGAPRCRSAFYQERIPPNRPWAELI